MYSTLPLNVTLNNLVFKIPSIIPAIKFAQFGPKDAVISTFDIFLSELEESIVSFIGLEFIYSTFEL